MPQNARHDPFSKLNIILFNKDISSFYLSRRATLSLLSAVPILSLNPRATHASDNYLRENILREMVDSLIPADDYSPSGSELQINANILSISNNVPNYPLMIDLGTEWLEQNSINLFAKSFTDISDENKNEVLRLAHASPPETLPNVFLTRIRNDAMTLYYAHPQIWPTLGFDGPIQPNGFTDFQEEPSR